MYRVEVKQMGGCVGFEFNNLADATKFISDCMECGDYDTEIRILNKGGKENE